MVKTQNPSDRKQISESKGYVHLLLIPFLAVYVALWSIYPHEMTASDPWAYSERAFQLASDYEFSGDHVFSHRLWTYVPLALIYRIFGVSALTTNLWPLLATLLIILTVWAALPDTKSRIIGALLCLTSAPLFEYSVKLYPDIIAAAFMVLSSLLLFSRKNIVYSEKKLFIYAIASVFFMFFAFLAKMSAYWVLPLWLIAIVADSKHNERSRLFKHFYIPVLVAGLFLGVAYLVFCYEVWGDPLVRFKNIQSMSGDHLWSRQSGDFGQLVKRLTILPADLFLNQYGAAFLLLALLGFGIAKESVRPWGYYTLFCVVFFWFGTTSFTYYDPMPLVQRMTLPALPGIYILCAYLLSRLTLVSLQPAWIRHLLPVFLVLVLAGPSFSQYVETWKDKTLPEAEAIQIVKQSVESNPGTNHLLVCSDTRSPRFLSFHFGYRYPANLNVLAVADLTKELIATDKRFLFLNRERSLFLTSAYGKRHYDNEIISLGFPELYKTWPVALFSGKSREKMAELIPP